MWLKETKKNSTQTLNLRLSAIKSFLKYCGEEDIELMSIYLDVSSIHVFKGTKNPCVEYLTQDQLKFLFSLPDMTTKLGRRDRFFMIFAYETGARLQELLDLLYTVVEPFLTTKSTLTVIPLHALPVGVNVVSDSA